MEGSDIFNTWDISYIVQLEAQIQKLRNSIDRHGKSTILFIYLSFFLLMLLVPLDITTPTHNLFRKGTTTIYYLQTGWSNPGTPSSGTDETPGSWTTTVPTFAVGKSIWFTIGTKPAGSSTWTFTYPQLYLGDLTYSVPGVLDDYLNTNVII